MHIHTQTLGNAIGKASQRSIGRRWRSLSGTPSTVLISAMFAVSLLLFSSAGFSSEVKGTMTVNGEPGTLRYASAIEVDSDTEPGYLDVLVVLSDRKLTPEQMQDLEKLEKLSFKKGLVAVRLLLDPDCKPKSWSFYHPAFKVFLVNAGNHEWKPSAFDEVVAGTITTDGMQEAVNQKWEFDLTFSTPIQLDPEAVTVP